MLRIQIQLQMKIVVGLAILLEMAENVEIEVPNYPKWVMKTKVYKQVCRPNVCIGPCQFGKIENRPDKCKRHGEEQCYNCRLNRKGDRCELKSTWTCKRMTCTYNQKNSDGHARTCPFNFGQRWNHPDVSKEPWSARLIGGWWNS